MPAPLRRAPARTAAVAVLLSLTACGEDTAEIGAARTVVSGPTTDASAGVAPASTEVTPEETPQAPELDPRLAPEPTTVGSAGVVSLHLPLGWETQAGGDLAWATAEATISGGHQITSLPAEGRSAEEWVADLVSGSTSVFDGGEGMVEKDPLTTAEGLTLFHLAQGYSDNRAQVFGVVVDDTLHLLRFGLDGSEEAAEVAALSAATATFA